MAFKWKTTKILFFGFYDNKNIVGFLKIKNRK